MAKGGRRGSAFAVVASACVIAVACGGGDDDKHPAVCDPGERQDCRCPGSGELSSQACLENATGWGECDCTPGDGGASGGPSNSSGGRESSGSGGSEAPASGGSETAGSSGGPTGTGGESAGAGGVAGGSGADQGVGGSTAGTAGMHPGGGSSAAGGGSDQGAGGATAGAAGFETAGSGGASGGGEGGSAGSASGGAGGVCAGVVCSGDCTDVTTDANHCGACDHACTATNASDLQCNAGVCSPTCSDSFLDCNTPDTSSADDGCETDGDSDLENCGTCENACDDNALNAEPACNAGVCEHTCDAGWEDCNGDLNEPANNGCEIDITTEPDHCGDCNQPCLAPKVCQGGKCDWPSCGGMDGTECNGESCCSSLAVPGGTFPMGRGTEQCTAGEGGAGGGGGCVDGCPSEMACMGIERPEHPAVVGAFSLDKYEVTVGRFRAFLDAFDVGWRPSDGEGANSTVEAAQGLAVGATGWQGAWDAELPTDGYQASAGDGSLEDRIACDPGGNQAWTNPAAASEVYAVNCINWYEAFAFCIWDGGRLPTEAEFEYVAAGGDENRVYPWGNDTTDPAPANYTGTASSPLIPVGSYADGNGLWGHADLAGSVWEWLLDWHADDWYTTTQTGCTNCANLTSAVGREVRGGVWYLGADRLRAARRSYSVPADHYTSIGFRCARDVP